MLHSRKGCLVRGVMAGKKSKAEAKTQGRRGAGYAQSVGIDDVPRRVPPMRTQDDLSVKQVHTAAVPISIGQKPHVP